MEKDFTTYEDNDLIKCVREQGQESGPAFAEMYDRYASRLYAYCRRVMSTKEQSEDLFQETFYRFYNSIITKNEHTSVMGFLITIARNLCLNMQRDKKQLISIEEMASFDRGIALSDNDSNDDIELKSELIIMTLDLLDPEYKELLVMKYYSNLEYSEIAEILGITVNNVRVKVYRAKEQIKTILSDYKINI